MNKIHIKSIKKNKILLYISNLVYRRKKKKPFAKFKISQESLL